MASVVHGYFYTARTDMTVTDVGLSAASSFFSTTASHHSMRSNFARTSQIMQTTAFSWMTEYRGMMVVDGFGSPRTLARAKGLSNQPLIPAHSAWNQYTYLVSLLALPPLPPPLPRHAWTSSRPATAHQSDRPSHWTRTFHSRCWPRPRAKQFHYCPNQTDIQDRYMGLCWK